METKFCKKCGHVKPLSSFSVNVKSRDGHQSYCKECIAAYHRSRKKSIEAAKPVFYLGLNSFNLPEAERALIKRCMKDNPGLTQFEIAEKCGVSERTIQSKLEEHGIKKPGIPIGGGSFSSKDYKQKKLCDCHDRELLEELWDRGYDGHFWKYVKQEANLSKMFKE